MSELFSFIHLPVFGLVIGNIIGLTGVGGGSLMTPVLVGGLGIPLAIDVGTDLLFASITKSFGAVAHWRVGNVAKRLLGVLIASSFTGAVLAFAVIHQLQPNIEALNKVIKSSLGIALFITAFARLTRPWLLKFRPTHEAHNTTAASAGCAGQSLGDRNVGLRDWCGSDALVRCRRCDWRDCAVATASVFAHLAHRGHRYRVRVPLTEATGLAHASVGNLDVNLLIGLLIGSVPGILLGARGCRNVFLKLQRAAY